jgi:hypothetical protein
LLTYGRVDSEAQKLPRRTPSPFASTSSMTRSHHWVKDTDAPVDVAPPGFHEFYDVLRSKALFERPHSAPGGCSYDMSVSYQFWSHFLVRSPFCFGRFALQVAGNRVSRLIKFYGESLLSCQNVVHDVVAHDFVDLLKSKNQTVVQLPISYGRLYIMTT